MEEQPESRYCNCLYYSANALARKLTKMAEEAFASTGLAPSYAFLLLAVTENPGIQPTELSWHMQLKASTVTRLVEKMEYKGYLERKRSGRATEIYPTPEGNRLNGPIKSAWRGLKERYTNLLGADVAEELRHLSYEASKKLGMVEGRKKNQTV